MMEAVRGYLLRLTAGAFLSAGLLALIPKGTSKKAAAVLCGLVMLLLALTPLAQLDYDALSEAISRHSLMQELYYICFKSFKKSSQAAAETHRLHSRLVS